MGKKSKRPSRPRASNPQPSLNSLHNRAICKLVDELWERTQALESTNLQYLWAEFQTVRDYTQQILDKQGSSPSPLPERGVALTAMQGWLREHGVRSDAVEIAEIPEVGYGLRATKDIKTEEKVIAVPRKLMLTLITAREGPLGNLIAQDKMLQMMPNVTLAVHLLNERYNPKSFWKPYIDALPHEFATPFYFPKEDLKEMQSSPCLVKTIVQIRNVSKLYAHLHRVIRTTCDTSLHLYESGFLLNDFLWAVSAVMSRQNEIPGKADGSGSVLALIPLWDLCNHTEGHMTTFYNLEERSCDCYALQDTPTGEEFRIFYGARANYDLLTHQGFVYMENKSDSIQIRLGLSTDDPLYQKRKKILEAINIPILGGEFSIYKTESPFSQQLVAFTRVFTASSHELDTILLLEPEKLAQVLLGDDWSGDYRVLQFLETRCLILLRSYATSLDHDLSLLDRLESFSPHSRLAIQVRICEKRILTNGITYAKTVLRQLDAIKQTQQHDEVTQDQSQGSILVVPAPSGRMDVSGSGFIGNVLSSKGGEAKPDMTTHLISSERLDKATVRGETVKTQCEDFTSCLQETVVAQESGYHRNMEEGTLGIEELALESNKAGY